MLYLRYLLFSLILIGCIDFEQTGKNLGAGLSDGIKQNADTVGTRLGAGLVRGARDTLTSAETERRLGALVEQVGRTLAQQVAASRDSLMGEYTRVWIAQLKDELLGKRTRTQLGDLRDELLGPKTTAFLRDSLATVAAALRESLIGAKTEAAVDSIVAGAVYTLSKEYRDKMQPIVHQEEGFAQRHASALLWTAGGVIAAVLVVAGIIFVRRKKDRSLLGLLTYQIHRMPTQTTYDELVARIQSKAQEAGLEPRLKEVLQEQGILGKENWRPGG